MRTGPIFLLKPLQNKIFFEKFYISENSITDVKKSLQCNLRKNSNLIHEKCIFRDKMSAKAQSAMI